MSTEPMTTTASHNAPPTASRPRVLARGAWIPAVLTTASLLAEYGFYSPLVPIGYCRTVQILAVLMFLLGRITLAKQSADTRHWLTRCWLEVAILPAGAIAAVATAAPILAVAATAGAIYVTLRQAALWVAGLLHRTLSSAAECTSPWPSVGWIVGSYLLLMVAGGALLAIPAGTISDHRNAPYTHCLNSLFVAGSAVTGSGLTVYPFPAEYTLFGRMVMLTLIQLGSLAGMIFGTVFGLTLVRALWPASSTWSAQWDVRHLTRIAKAILATTLCLEAIGSAAIFIMQPTISQNLFDRLFEAVFLAVSAFCNAGFSLRPDALLGAGGVGMAYGAVMPLIILGGLGFPVLYETASRIGRWSRQTGHTAPLLTLPPGCWSLHTKIVLATTFGLILAVATALWYFETPWRHGGFWYVGNSNMLAADDAIETMPLTMRGHSSGQRACDALFQSASVRTTGLKTVVVKPGAISPASLTLMMGSMLIGGSPGSTAGGLHTIPFVLLIAAALGTLRRRDDATLLGVSLPEPAIRRVTMVFLAGLTWLGLTILVLTHLQRSDFMAIVVEAVSAISTNSLSLGITPNLTPGGKTMLLVTMLLGRVAPLTLLLVSTPSQPPQAAPQASSTEPLLLT